MLFSNEEVLVIAAHPDDETLGMGGTIHKLGLLGSRVRVVFLSDGVNSREDIRESLVSRRTAATKALKILNCSDVYFCDYPDNSMDSVTLIDIVKTIEDSINDFSPTVLFTHFPHDLNVDHRITGQACLVAARPKVNCKIKSLLFFEVQSSTEWNFGASQFKPNMFVDITESFEVKMKALREYQVEIEAFPEARSFAGIEARSMVRGVTVGVSNAEAFQIAFMRE
ncbi:GlcNAc-PI de-N-acetylase [Candidatus Planktophila dulcis]|nr:GlcNAc-PI de-N-acetylase [Candidatus Planktophila dulcis]